MAAPGRWVDFGLTTLSLGLVIPEEEDGQEGGGDGGGGGSGDDASVPDIVHFHYSELASEPRSILCPNPTAPASLTPCPLLHRSAATAAAPAAAAAAPAAADVTRAALAPGATSGFDKLTVALRAMPEVLQKTSQNFRGCGCGSCWRWQCPESCRRTATGPLGDGERGHTAC